MKNFNLNAIVDAAHDANRYNEEINLVLINQVKKAVTTDAYNTFLLCVENEKYMVKSELGNVVLTYDKNEGFELEEVSNHVEKTKNMIKRIKDVLAEQVKIEVSHINDLVGTLTKLYHSKEECIDVDGWRAHKSAGVFGINLDYLEDKHMFDGDFIKAVYSRINSRA